MFHRFHRFHRFRWMLDLDLCPHPETGCHGGAGVRRRNPVTGGVAYLAIRHPPSADPAAETDYPKGPNA
ncbi:hypothetical protein ACFCYC_01780 [Streptomyces sp. NPDC056402]|uniref:hypothetical protein n=1 Tax=Streptomyces sp. NPDC056402 TaxID=3345810 RepID=UPI0035DA7ECD